MTPGRQANLGLCLYNRPSAVAFIFGLPYPIDKTTIHWHAPTARCIAKKHSPLVCANGAVHRKNRRSAVVYVSTGLARLPRDTGGARNYRRRAVVERYCVEENRRRAVSYVSTGLACLPRDTGGARNYRRRAVVERGYAYGYKESAPRIAPRGAS